jgi:hypothetical protein
MNQEGKQAIQSEKVCRTAFISNLLLLMLFVYMTYQYWILGTDDLEGSTRSITLGIGVAFILLDILTALALKAFLQNNKLVKLYFIILAVFTFPFAIGYGLPGLFIVIFLIFTLFVNVMCYRKMHPEK